MPLRACVSSGLAIDPAGIDNSAGFGRGRGIGRAAVRTGIQRRDEVPDANNLATP